MMDDISRIEDEARRRLASASTLDELRAAEAEVLGRRSPLVGLRQRLGSLDPEERRVVGKALNAALEAVAAVAAEHRAALEAAERAEKDRKSVV